MNTIKCLAPLSGNATIYEHIIRNEESLNRIREYIANNPLQWALDRENPNFVGTGPGPAPTMGQEPWRI